MFINYIRIIDFYIKCRNSHKYLQTIENYTTWKFIVINRNYMNFKVLTSYRNKSTLQSKEHRMLIQKKPEFGA